MALMLSARDDLFGILRARRLVALGVRLAQARS